jgi:hypothetical protein
MLLCEFVGSMPQNFPSFARGVIQVNDNITQRLHVEEIIAWWQFDAPTADSSLKFEGKVSFVAKV